MKTYTVNFCYSVHEDITIRAKNEREALKKFREVRPDERVLDVYEVNEQEPIE